MIGISLDSDGLTVAEFVSKHKISWRQVLDSVEYGGKFGREYGVEFIPTAILVAPDGTILDTMARGSRLEKLVAKHIKSVTNKDPIKIPEKVRQRSGSDWKQA